MVRLTRKSKQKKGVHTIPELRRSFEAIETFVDTMMQQKLSHEKMSKRLRKEWHIVFKKDLDKKSADAFIGDRTKTRRFKGIGNIHGGSRGGAIAGAPLEYTTRAGEYLAPSDIPRHGYGGYTDYVGKGFTNPEIAQQYDPIKGQSEWPVPYSSTGSNMVGGSRSNSARMTVSARHLKSSGLPMKRRLRKGGGPIESAGAFLSQAFMHPIPSSSPPGILQDIQGGLYGKQLGPSPDQVQRQSTYSLGSLYPTPISIANSK